MTNPDLDSTLGIFKSRKQARDFLTKIAKEHNLCEKLLELEKTNNTCFSYRLGQCKGACIGIEKPIKYNMRYTSAFAASKTKPWPFPGTIIIEESDGSKKEYFLINKWCYIDSIKTDSEGNKDTILFENYTFDLDIYNIIKQFLSNSQNYKKKLSSLKLTQSNFPKISDYRYKIIIPNTTIKNPPPKIRTNSGSNPHINFFELTLEA